MKRKNINDVIYGDRAAVRAAKTFSSSTLSYGSYGYGKKSTSSSGKWCYESHPPLKLPGTNLVIYGGSCSNPVVKDADVYIGFDLTMKFTERHWPWNKGAEVLFHIQDMGVPSKPEEFKKLVAWTKKKLEAGLKVHCGCIGGHGRTGTFLAALVSEYGEQDAISYVREHYCYRAVESSEQIEFLRNHFGIKSVKASKSGSVYSYSTGSKGKDAFTYNTVSKGKDASTYNPIPSMGNIWGCS